MSDIPDSYFVNGVELLDFRREYCGIYAPGEVRQSKRKRRNKKVAAPRRSILYLRDGNNCHYCNVEMDKPDRGPNSVSVEHVVPRSLGGSNDISNLVLACVECNNGFSSEYIKCVCDFCKNARYQHENN